ncbi:ligand-binding sensor domain-containing protein [Sunxiuqinia elliptica]|uniref:Two component regulator propeller n=1 Tax=Sunxiuqinia elliptica TaxID=655355 RepID=A0A1I2HPW4_9BACT|nr:hypothetical protein [Sunxiuqinia elliptica]SFF32174.1 hypothetical protein SAMN05216283_104217 [Sunxiuqinia elliptica]
MDLLAVFRNWFIACLLVFGVTGSVLAQPLYQVDQQLWKPQKDEVFLQESVQKITTDEPVTAVAATQGTCYALIGKQLFQVDDGKLVPASQAPEQVVRLKAAGGAVWALTSHGIYRNQGNAWKLIDNQIFVDVCMHAGALHAATSEEIFRLENDRFVSTKPEGGYYTSNMTMLMEDGTQLHADPVRLGPIDHIESYSGTLYILRPGRIVLFDGKTVNDDFVDWGVLPSRNTRDFLSYGSRLFIATDRGLGVLQGAALKTIRGEDGLPVENTTCLERGFDQDIWIGTERGAVRMLNDEWHYFGADIWLPDNRVNALAVDNQQVFIATNGGLSILSYEPYTLQKKAAYYEHHLEAWGHKRMGFIHTLDLKNGEWVREISDNDGSHTASYLAAMCYKYAVTGDKQAREEAVESFKAMLWLEQVTPIDGFFARSIWSITGDKGEMGKHGSGGLPAKWYPTPDGKWYWKGDTSSDEAIAHFYSVSLFHDLVADGKEKEMAREHLAKISNYIIDCGWTLHDMDGKPTRWGRWNPEYLLRPYGYVDRGVNGLEALTFMQTALALTGNQKFADGYQQLIDWGYPANTIRQKNVFPPENLAPWDDELAFYSYYTLLRYEKDPVLRSVYLRSLERTWEVKRMEHIPWFNFAYGVITGNDCDVQASVEHLRAWTLDPTEHTFRNSHRDDLHVEAGYTSYEGGLKAISPREKNVVRGSRNAVVLDGGRHGHRIMEPTGFVRDYWMGRYHGFIEAPETNDPKLLDVEVGEPQGAAPYQGPSRPKVY